MFFIEPSQNANNVATSSVKVSYAEWSSFSLDPSQVTYLSDYYKDTSETYTEFIVRKGSKISPVVNVSPVVINDQSSYLPFSFPDVKQIVSDAGLSTQKHRLIPGDVL